MYVCSKYFPKCSGILRHKVVLNQRLGLLNFVEFLYFGSVVSIVFLVGILYYLLCVSVLLVVWEEDVAL